MKRLPLLLTGLVLLIVSCFFVSADVSTADVVHAWEFENGWNDSVSGTGNWNLTVSGTINLNCTSAKLGVCSADFSAGEPSNYLITNWFDYTNSHSLEFWVSLSGWSAGDYAVLWSTNNTNAENRYLSNLANAGAWGTGQNNALTLVATHNLVTDSNWAHLVLTYNSTNTQFVGYINGTKIGNVSGVITNYKSLIFGRWATDYNRGFHGRMDSLRIYNRTLTPADVTELWNNGNGLQYPFNFGVPVISGINCTSCNPPSGDTVPPYTTSDTTPTFTFSTNIAANCRIGSEDWNYTNMNSSRDCTSGEGTTAHTCTLTVPDELIYSTDYVFLSCINLANNNQSSNSTSGPLQMEITGLSNTTTSAIDAGIQKSSIWPGATIYSNQQVYLRDLNNNQVLGTVDRVAVYGSQRWIFSVGLENESKLGLFNLTPVVYVYDVVNISSTTIQDQIAALINSTKR